MTSELQSHVHTALSKMWSLQKKRARIVLFMWRREEVIILPLWYFPLKVDSVAGFGPMVTFLTPPQASFCSQNQRNCIIKWQSMSTKQTAWGQRTTEGRITVMEMSALCLFTEHTATGNAGEKMLHPRLTQDNTNVWKMAPSLHSTHQWTTCQHGVSNSEH